ncbi:hypothetical protein ACN38_g3875 [Penicillium nordicum]|uniref:SRR1-like domain-containing protein n=1 Tax=Penicillium nordicum TaxID=229535 RepID=A0A0M9WHN1_9EURO|nr:hypothetical protein ACN38_g3875 [Penicillium nordicum]
MPHTSHPSRRKQQTQKRTQVTDDDGWTHVASGGNVRRVMRTRPRVTTAIKELEPGVSSGQPEEPILAPAEAPGRLTLSDLQTQFQTHRERWEASESWTKLTGVLDERLKKAQEQADPTLSPPSLCPVDAIVCIGLGSPSGFLRDGWVDRRSVSLYQLAALASIKDQVACSFPDLFGFGFLALVRLYLRPTLIFSTSTTDYRIFKISHANNTSASQAPLPISKSTPKTLSSTY